MQAQQNPNIPVSEIYCSLLHKADKKFSKIRELPYYHRNRHEYDAYFYKVFKVYTQLWKFQQENRQKLVESGLRRSEIGEIASRIAQLYLGQYMRTSEASYLSEAYIFYEAILSREYFKEGMFQDLSLANKQLWFISRFLMVCLLLNRPLRYSIVLDCHPDSLPHVSTTVAKRSLRLRDAILSSYHHNEVKFSELTLDTFRMLQCLEWEPSGSFYQSSGAKNVLATFCEELPPDGVILIYLSASGAGMYSDVMSPSTLAYSSDRINPSRGQGSGIFFWVPDHSHSSHSIGAPLLHSDNSDDMIQQLVAVLEAVSTEARKQAAMEIRLLAKNKLKNRLKIARNVVIKPLISLLLSSDLQF
ncbi:hypothetical protein ACFX15_034082 [Malus domestica]